VATTWFTTLASIRAAEPEWQAIACYREPVARFLRRVYPGLAPDLRDDIVQEVLCAMRTSVVARFRPERGRFRDYLKGVIQNQVRAAARARMREASPALDPDAVAAAPAVEVDAVDLAARLVLAVRDAHDGFLQGSEADRQVLYCLSDRLTLGLGYEEIAAKEGISRDAVKRRLAAARRAVLRALLARALAEAEVEVEGRRLNKLAERFAEALASRRPADELFARVRPPEAREVAAELVGRVREGLRSFPGLDSPDGQSFVTALAAVLEGGA
jgi:RNA polymerase sigma factor (sigma-70 family)